MNYEPVFLSAPDDWKARWQLLREFIRRWHMVELRDVGNVGDLVQAEEKKIGFALPPSFREWVSLASELLEQRRFGIFRDAYDVRNLEELSATSLLLIREGNYIWAVKNENLGQDDPPVDGFVLDYDLSPERFVWLARESEHLTGFVLDHLTFYLHGSGGGCMVEIEIDNDLLEEIKSCFDTHCVFDHIHVFEKPNMVAFIISNSALHRGYLVFEIWKTTPRQEVPECIEKHIHGGGSFHGMLVPE